MLEISPKAKKAFETIESSGMMSWVGGGDPSTIGSVCFNAIAAAVELKPNMRVLDFGCGIGRNTILMADFLCEGELVGVDIVPRMIDFCQTQITGTYPNTSFMLSSTENPLYDKYQDNSNIETVDMFKWAKENEAKFDFIYAFSVFTHLDPKMAQSTMDLFTLLIKPGGSVFFTTFLDCESNPLRHKLQSGEDFRDCEQESLLWVVYAPSFLSNMALRSDFLIKKILFGSWRGVVLTDARGDQYQDAILLTKLVPIPADFDPEVYVSLHPDLVAAKVDGTAHYQVYGYFEGRRHR